MIEQGWQRLDLAARRLLPFASILACTLLSVIVMPFPYFGSVSPLLSITAIYIWAIYRPDLVRPSTVFIVGILNDCIHNYPIGLSALIMVALYQLTVMQRRLLSNFGFRLVWICFAIAIFVYILAMWLMMCMINTQWITPVPLIIQALLTIAIFPVPSFILLALHKFVLSNS